MSCFPSNRRLIVSLLFLLVSSLSKGTFMAAEGRSLDVAEKGMKEEKRTVMRNVIGSRPPTCERRCSWCAHCEAIQVPITTQFQNRRSPHLSVPYSRGNDVSNY
ncbi:EPIDERMAL PATTERNING FACTOR-like protein 2 [Hibiscus syriacus]|uniref:EPIDERMAL PATTERNING FACTOR-like protein 2 n=1 Tax=Hibiscus syriacus TaxID=106335 RepID=UPI0019251119|nr:EPIDERMAL PATTERNING FACTOR-like protein 2 [Hibiscus syriacus]